MWKKLNSNCRDVVFGGGFIDINRCNTYKDEHGSNRSLGGWMPTQLVCE